MDINVANVFKVIEYATRVEFYCVKNKSHLKIMEPVARSHPHLFFFPDFDGYEFGEQFSGFIITEPVRVVNTAPLEQTDNLSVVSDLYRSRRCRFRFREIEVERKPHSNTPLRA